MEYTGSYYQQLAIYLYENDVSVSVINPLVLKRFIQMKLQHNKTDKGDAKMIVQYAQGRGSRSGFQAHLILISVKICTLQ